MPVYKIPVRWEMYGFVKVEADDLDEAMEKAEAGMMPEGEYINESFEVDYDEVDAYNTEKGMK